MARARVTLTGAFQQLASGICVIRVAEGSGKLSLNESASDTAALEDRVNPGDQYTQNEDKPTFAKGEGIVLIVDTAG